MIVMPERHYRAAVGVHKCCDLRLCEKAGCGKPSHLGVTGGNMIAT